MARGSRRLGFVAPLLLALAIVSPVLAEAAGAPQPAAPPRGAARPAPLALDVANATELVPNQSVSGTVGALAPRYFKVFGNRSDAAPETLTVTLEATGSLFGDGSLTVLDVEQVLLDELFTNGPGDLQVSNFIVPETGYYLLVVQSGQAYDWSVTVNRTVGADFPADNDNDLGNATQLLGDSGVVADAVTDWQDLGDTFAIDLTVGGATRDALLINLTSPNTADLDVYVFHLEAGVGAVDGLSITPTGTEFAAALASANQTYFVRVLSYAGSSNYTLEWSRLAVLADDNGVPAKATPLAAGGYLNNLSRWDTRDLFALDLVANTTLNVSFRTEGFDAAAWAPDLQAILWDAAFTRVSWSYTFDPDERIHVLIPAGGTYYLDVFGADFTYYLSTSLTFNYTMDVSIDPPPALANPFWNATPQEDEVASFDLEALVPPNPPGEPLRFSVAGASADIVASIAAGGRTLTVVPNLDWSGSAWISIEAEDARRVETIVLPLTYLAVNDAPRLAAGASPFAFDEDGAGYFGFTAAHVDPEGDAFAVLSASADPPLVAQPAPGGLDLSAPENFYGSLRLNLTVEDNLGARANLGVVVTVRSVNDAPSFQLGVGPFVLEEDATAAAASFNLTGLATDPDGDPVAYTLTGLTSASALIVGNSLSIHPFANFAGDLSATLTASDGLATVSLQVVVRVLPVDDPPVLLIPAPQQLAREGAEFVFSADADDIDSPLSSLFYSFVLDGVPDATGGGSRTFSHTFGFNDSGYHVLRVTVSDGNHSAAADVAIFVADTNRPPIAEILSPLGTAYRAGEVVSFSARALDLDGTSVNITWIVDGTAVSASPTFSLDGLSAGHHTVELRVYDGEFTSMDASSFEVQGGLPGAELPAALVALLVVSAVARRARRP